MFIEHWFKINIGGNDTHKKRIVYLLGPLTIIIVASQLIWPGMPLSLFPISGLLGTGAAVISAGAKDK